MLVFIVLSSVEILYTEKSHVRTLKVLLIKFSASWPIDLIDLRDELMPKLEEILDIHRTELHVMYCTCSIALALNVLCTEQVVQEYNTRTTRDERRLEFIPHSTFTCHSAGLAPLTGSLCKELNACRDEKSNVVSDISFLLLNHAC